MTADPKVGLVIVGCGDVFARHYRPALEALADRVHLRVLVDPRPGAADEAARSVAAWSPGAIGERDLTAALARPGLNAAVNLTPAPLHGSVNRSLLEAGLHLYSEKPLASSVAEADTLIDLAARGGL